MESQRKKLWTRYTIVFLAILFGNSLVRRLLPYEELKDGNLLVNAVFSLIVTLLILAANRLIQKMRQKSSRQTPH